MKDETIKWIEAGKLFSANSDSKFTCPDCGKCCLESEDIVLPSEEVFERRIYCKLCGSENFMRLQKKSLRT